MTPKHCLPLTWFHPVNTIILDDERSSGLIKGVSFGVLAPGVSALKTLYLANTGAAGERVLDFSIQSTATGDVHENIELRDMTETLQTLVVPTVNPLAVGFDVVYRRTLGEQLGLADLKTFESDFWDDVDGGEAVVTFRMVCAEPWSLEIESVKLVTQVKFVYTIWRLANSHDIRIMITRRFLVLLPILGPRKISFLRVRSALNLHIFF